MTVHQLKSDALGFFGATGDLTYKKIFPALQQIQARYAHGAGEHAAPHVRARQLGSVHIARLRGGGIQGR
jgi:hypothetical protein